jgi:hypothetical protein
LQKEFAEVDQSAVDACRGFESGAWAAQHLCDIEDELGRLGRQDFEVRGIDKPTVSRRFGGVEKRGYQRLQRDVGRRDAVFRGIREARPEHRGEAAHPFEGADGMSRRADQDALLRQQRRGDLPALIDLADNVA